MLKCSTLKYLWQRSIGSMSIVFLTCFVVSAAAERPNVVVILVDDMGFSDLGCYGGEIPTPNLDALAAGGLKFKQFYNTGRCCPTRASLLTGLYSHQAGIGHMTADYGLPGYQGFLNDSCVTIGDVAKSAGYLTAVSGKWHVGSGMQSRLPLARGFDHFYGVPEGGGFYFQVKKGRTLMLDDNVIATPTKNVASDWYSTDAFSDWGLKFVDDAVQQKKPFLLYLAHNAPHFPLQATAEDIAQFRGKFLDGWDKLSRARLRRQVASGLIDADFQKAARPDGVAEWSSLSTAEKDRFDHLMAAYAACVWRMDQSVGALVDGLQERGVFDNTLILFMSDNGGCAEGGTSGKSTGDPTTADSNWFCGESWAYLQDTPFRKFKHYNHEGGIATPLLAHWPNGIAEKGVWRNEPTHVIDVMATIVEVTGGEYPESRDGQAIHAMEGSSLLPIFSVDSNKSRELFWEHEGNAAVRQGDWKLVRVGGRGPWELYDMKTDRTESRDLSADHPAKVDALSKLWSAWADRVGANKDGLPGKAKRKNAKRKSNGPKAEAS